MISFWKNFEPTPPQPEPEPTPLPPEPEPEPSPNLIPREPVRVRAEGGTFILENAYVVASEGRAVDVRNQDLFIVRNCHIVVPATTPIQTDGIYSMNNKRVRIEDTRIEIRNRDDYGHSDAFQSYQDGEVILTDSLFSTLGPPHNHPVWIADARVVDAEGITSISAGGPFNFTVWNTGGYQPTESIRIAYSEFTGGRRILNFENVPEPTLEENELLPDSHTEHEIFRSKIVTP